MQFYLSDVKLKYSTTSEVYMSKFIKSVSGVLSGAGRAAKAYPTTVGCAVAFALICLLQIQFDLSDYSFALGCVQWALALGALAGMTAVAAAQTYMTAKNAPLLSNLIALGITVITFVLLYVSGGADQELSQSAAMRVMAAIFIALVAFIIIAGRPSRETDFTRSLFMAHKSFFIALLYGLVALAGASGVAGAVEGLIYPDMSYKVYQYIVTLAGLLAFLLFVGYFPPLGIGEDPERREHAQRKPSFIVVLLSYILIPIMLALTAVLLIWALLNVFGVTKSNFGELAAVSAAYTLGGLWLHAMTADGESALTRLYRTVYPVAALVILAFEAWAVVAQLMATGLKTTEYAFIIIWLLAAVGSILLLTMRSDEKRAEAHRSLAVVSCVLALAAVLPGVGYIDLPVSAQTARLESLLEREGILEDGKLTPADKVPDKETRAAITDAVDFLAFSGGNLPAWFDKGLYQGEVFYQKFGFEKLWVYDDGTTSEDIYDNGMFLFAESGAVEIGGYDWAVSLAGRYSDIGVKTDRGEYVIAWENPDKGGAPVIKITFDGKTVIERSLDDFVDQLKEKYPSSFDKNSVPQNELSLEITGEGITALLTLSEISVTEYKDSGRNIWVTPDYLFIKEN